MSLPRLHFRLVDDLGHVLVDEDVWIGDEAEAGDRHADLALAASRAGRRTTMTITDPDGDIPTTTVVTEPL